MPNSEKWCNREYTCLKLNGRRRWGGGITAMHSINFPGIFHLAFQCFCCKCAHHLTWTTSQASSPLLPINHLSNQKGRQTYQEGLKSKLCLEEEERGCWVTKAFNVTSKQRAWWISRYFKRQYSQHQTHQPDSELKPRVDSQNFYSGYILVLSDKAIAFMQQVFSAIIEVNILQVASAISPNVCFTPGTVALTRSRLQSECVKTVIRAQMRAIKVDLTSVPPRPCAPAEQSHPRDARSAACLPADLWIINLSELFLFQQTPNDASQRSPIYEVSIPAGNVA